MAEIRFGTDGWRAVIAEDYTFDNVRAVAQATADWLRGTGQAGRGVVIGYDTRFLSDAFANATAEVFAANGITVALASTAAPTPALSHAVLDRGAAAGVVITASHNPARWNGFKIKQASGNSAPTRGHERDRAGSASDPERRRPARDHERERRRTAPADRALRSESAPTSRRCVSSWTSSASATRDCASRSTRCTARPAG